MLRACLVACVGLAAPIAFAAAPPPLWRNLSAWENVQISAQKGRLNLHAAAGDFAKAAEVARKIAEFRSARQGAVHWQAVDAFYEIEDWRRLAKVEEKERPAVLRARALNETGTDLLNKGRNREAEKPLRAALAILLKALGEGHPDTASSFNNLAYCLDNQGKHAEAIKLYRRALTIRQKALGESHPETAGSYNNLAHCLDRLGKHADALPLHRRALAIRQKAQGDGHPDTANCYNNAASCLDDQGRHAEALPLHRHALAIRLKTLGGGHPDTALSYNNAASCLNSQGRHAEALPLHRHALAIRQKALGDLHPDSADSYNNVASSLNSQGRHAEALPLYHRALAIRQKALGEGHPDTATSFNNLAYCLDRLGRHADALPSHRRALAIRQKALGEGHPDTASSYNNLAMCLERLGDHARALPLHRQALAIRQKALGEGHRDTASSYNNLARCLESHDEYAEALPLYRRALALYQKILGDDHPDTAVSYNNVAVCLDRQGKHAEALRLLQASLPGQEAARFHTASSGFDRAFASANKVSPHALLAALLARLGQPADAFRHAELSLARGLLDDLAGSSLDDLQRIAALSAEIESLNASLLPLTTRATLTTEEEAQRQGLVKQRRKLESERSRLTAAVSGRQVLPLVRIQKQIPDDAALVLWIDTYDRRVACVLRRDGPPVWEKLPGSGTDGSWTKDDVGLARRAYASVTDPSQGDASRKALYGQCLAPLEPHLRGVKRLLVVPTGPVARVPVEALSDRWLVSYVPSGSAFARSAEKPAPKRSTSALVLADPTFTSAPPVRPKAPPHGLLVSAVLSGGLAQRVGLRPGDVLLEYAGKVLKSADDLETAAGDERVALKLWRDGKVMAGRIPAGTLGVTVDKRPIADALAAWREKEGKRLAARGGKEWDALPGTRLEARSLERLLPGATLLLGSEASEPNLQRLASAGKLRGLGFLHLATHGEANPTRPRETALILAQDRLPSPKEQEALVLAGGRPVEGRLTVGAVLEGWRLDAELVSLSACQTGLGADAAGEGMLGFAQALLQKGARSVLLSRWKVDDGATALLMVRFYENLLGKREGLQAPLAKAEALREAREWLRGLSRAEALKRLAALTDGLPRGERGKARPKLPTRRVDAAGEDRPFAHPYFWAAFVLVGDPC